MVAAPSTGSFASDEDVWFGQDAYDSEAEARAEQSAAALGARIIGAKPFPIAARRLEELTRNPKARLEQVVSVLETDPGLSVRLLRLVNSAGYGLKVRVTSVRHAAVLVGTRRLHQVATTAAILDLFDTSNETAVELLEHATVVGSLCRYLAVHLGLPHDELFTCGFLHDIGKLMLLDTEAEKYAELVQTYGGGPDQLHVHERRIFGFDHAVLGAHVLTAWNIPDPVPKVVKFHHQPARAMQEDSVLSSMVHALRLADLMSYAVALDSGAAGVSLVAGSEAAQYLEISEPQLAVMWLDIRALADRSRARSNGQPDLEVVAPRRLEVPRSLRPRRSNAPRALRTSEQPSVSIPLIAGEEPAPESEPRSSVKDVPPHFPCVACNKPCYGNVCTACRGQVCPEHQLGPDHWCVLCLREFDRFRQRKQIPIYFKATGLAVAGFSICASVTGAMVSQTFSAWKLLVAPLTMALLWAVLLHVAHRLWQRRRFLSTRPKGRIPLPIRLPQPNEVFISSLDANLENEGLMGPSLPPPSRGSASLLAASDAAHAAQAAAVESDARSPSLAPQPLKSPTTDRSPVDEPRVPAKPVSSVSIVDMGPTGDEKTGMAPSVSLEHTSQIIASAVKITQPATVALEPSAAAVVSVKSPRRKPSEGLSEFPSVSSESELENVVASVSARLIRDLPSNDYTGPSADLRAAIIAPIPEGLPSSRTMPSAALPQNTQPAAVQGEAAGVLAESPLELSASMTTDHALPAPAVAEPALAAEHAAPTFEADADPEKKLLPLLNLDHGCTTRSAFRCAIPVAESCSPVPGSTSLRRGPSEFETNLDLGSSNRRAPTPKP